MLCLPKDIRIIIKFIFGLNDFIFMETDLWKFEQILISFVVYFAVCMGIYNVYIKQCLFRFVFKKKMEIFDILYYLFNIVFFVSFFVVLNLIAIYCI